MLLGLNQAPSMNSVLRALKREDSSLFSCVASIADDAQFVEQASQGTWLIHHTGKRVTCDWHPPVATAGFVIAIPLHCSQNVSRSPTAPPCSLPRLLRTPARWLPTTPASPCCPTCAAACGMCAPRWGPPATSSRRTDTTTTGRSARCGSTWGWLSWRPRRAAASSWTPRGAARWARQGPHPFHVPARGKGGSVHKRSNASCEGSRSNSSSAGVLSRWACCPTAVSRISSCALQRFPDAMSKTIPMWCAVLNRAIHRLRQQTAAAAAAAPAAAGTAACGTEPSTAAAGPALAAEGPAAAASAGEPPGAAPWDCDLHLPPWVSDVERNSILQRLDGWVDDLFGVRQLRRARPWPNHMASSGGLMPCPDSSAGLRCSGAPRVPGLLDRRTTAAHPHAACGCTAGAGFVGPPHHGCTPTAAPQAAFGTCTAPPCAACMSPTARAPAHPLCR